MYVNDNEVKREIQKNPKIFKSVECYAGGKDRMSINGLVRNLKYNQSNKDFGKMKSSNVFILKGPGTRLGPHLTACFHMYKCFYLRNVNLMLSSPCLNSSLSLDLNFMFIYVASSKSVKPDSL